MQRQINLFEILTLGGFKQAHSKRVELRNGSLKQESRHSQSWVGAALSPLLTACLWSGYSEWNMAYPWGECISWAIVTRVWSFYACTYSYHQNNLSVRVDWPCWWKSRRCQLSRLITFSRWVLVQITESFSGRVCPVSVLLEVVDVISPFSSLNPL